MISVSFQNAIAAQCFCAKSEDRYNIECDALTWNDEILLERSFLVVTLILTVYTSTDRRRSLGLLTKILLMSSRQLQAVGDLVEYFCDSSATAFRIRLVRRIFIRQHPISIIMGATPISAAPRGKNT
jgi:hypothetical protein